MEVEDKSRLQAALRGLAVSSVIGIAVALIAMPSARAGVPEPFAAHAEQEQVDITYDDLSYILRSTVFDAGRSDRKAAPRPKPEAGRLIVKVNTSSTRLEGNRLYFPAFEGNNLKALFQLRRELEALPGAVPMAEWTKRQQLAYWLNLYNVTVMSELAERYPEQEIRKVMAKLRKQKILRVAGRKLSLDDIRYDILFEKWQDPLVMYGLWQGYVGGPNIRREAYTAENVYELLADNAAEFINSNRGTRLKGDQVYISSYYAENLMLFPDGEEGLKRHLVEFADPYYASHVHNAAELSMTTDDYYIADLFEGVPNDVNPNASNSAALQTAMGGPEWSDFASSGAAAAAGWGKVPPHVLKYIGEIRKKKSSRKANVEVEEYAGEPEEPEEAEAPGGDTPN
ncbi:DUF547 domain-containing protein [Kordiimonas gwangyangensis]|uniref:DUF547 domain-containing protein n=1 Tax=Kordiimonas gwangyangensis TaxID=288022 RepID=UPI000368E9FD|nr:DUF547 domain-containing protein [Kordiimonas gwangyangensis]